MAKTANFAGLPKDERTGLFDSLTLTLRRSEYHRRRYLELRKTLDERRANLPGEVFWDELVEVLHFEMQAFCGAGRMLMDEIMHLAARRHGVVGGRARRDPWETSKLMADPLPAPLPAECQVPEISAARQRTFWFKLLNAYRNQMFHHGWRHGSGHFSEDELRGAAKDPAANALIVPDQASLARKSKPHEWTYNDRTTTDDVVRLVAEGLDGLLRDLCEQVWSTPEPKPGAKPRSEHPNIIVSLVVPAVISVHDEAVVIPFFTTKEKALQSAFTGHPGTELVDIPTSSAVVQKRALTFSLQGLSQVALPPGTETIKVLVDPEVNGENWMSIRCALSLDLRVADVLANELMPISIPVTTAERVYTWRRQPDEREWVT